MWLLGVLCCRGLLGSVVRLLYIVVVWVALFAFVVVVVVGYD